MFTSVVEGLYRQHIAPGCEPFHTHAITLGKVLHVQEETPTAGQTERNRWNLGLNLGFPCWYALNKTKQNKGKSPLVNPRTEKASGVDLRGPRIRVSLEKDGRSAGTPRKLTRGPSICLKVWWKAYIGNI